MEKIIDRFDKYMRIKGLNDNKVTKEIKCSVGLIGKSRKEGRDMSRVLISDVLKCYNDLSSEWILFGRGNMLITPNSEIREVISKKTIEVAGMPSSDAVRLELLEKLYVIQERLLNEVIKDRDRLAGMIEDKKHKNELIKY